MDAATLNRNEPRTASAPQVADASRSWWIAAVPGAALVGLALLVGPIRASSATYDEVAYLRIAAAWWRTGEQEEIGRMGSPLTFWKLQQAPTLWLLDRTGHGALIDEPIACQAELLPIVRLGALWVWLVAFALTTGWAWSTCGVRAGAMAAWLFALSPNLLAHGALITMELPLVAAWTASTLLFRRFLETGRAGPFLLSAAAAGLAFSCKFTTVLLPPILGLAWFVDRLRRGDRRWLRLGARVAAGMAGFGLVLVLADLAVTAFATMTPSARVGLEHPSLGDARLARLAETPMPQDLVAFVNQVRHQNSGGRSYLLGQRRERGWWYYYLVALAVKVPLSSWLLIGGGVVLALHRRSRSWTSSDVLVGVTVAGMLAITAVASSRNYGVRYLLPIWPPVIVWVARLAEGPRWAARLAAVGIVGQAVAVALIHPYELSYFNALAGGPVGGRHILADSNLDWGQGCRVLASLQREQPDYRDLTFYAFGDADPGQYGVVGTRYLIDAHADHPGLPSTFRPTTRYVAVSSSLQHGPWGQAGYFGALDGVVPVRLTPDATIAIYRVEDIPFPAPSEEVTAPAQAVLEPVGEPGDPTDGDGGVEAGDGRGVEVTDDDEVFLAPQDLDGEVALDGHGVELQQVEGVAGVGRAADRDEGDDRTAVAVEPAEADVDGLPAVERHRHDQPVAVADRSGLIARAVDEVADQPGAVGVGRVGGLVRAEGVLRGVGVGLGRAEREPATRAEAARRVVLAGAAGADDRRVGHGSILPGSSGRNRGRPIWGFRRSPMVG